MADKIIKSDISVKDPAGDLIKSLDLAKKESIKLEKALSDQLKTQKELITLYKKPTNIKEIKNLNTAIDKTNKGVKGLNDTRKVSLQIDKEKEKELLKLKKLNSDRIQDVVQLKRLTKEQNAINKDTEILSTKNIGTLTKLSAANRKLIREQKGLNLETEKGRKRLIEINKTLDKNSKFIKDNSSAMQKQSQNVGNYSESIKEAAGASGLFGKILGPLAAVQGTLNALLKKNTVENQASAAATKANAVSTKKLSIAQKASALATGIGTKALKIFKFALASTGIGLLVIALGSLIAFFTRSQRGIDFLAVKMAGLGAAVDVVIDTFAAFGEAIFDALSEPEKIIKALIDFIKELPQIILDNLINRFKAFGVILRAIADRDLEAIADGFLQLGTGITDFSQKASDAIKAVKESAEAAAEAIKASAEEMAEKVKIAQKLKELTIDLSREEALFSARQATLITQSKRLILISKDKLKADEVRIQALKDANEIDLLIAKTQLELEEKSLAASLDSLNAKGDGLKLDKERLEFIEAIKNGTISTADAVEKSAAFTLSSAEGEEAFLEVIEKVVALEQAKQSLIDRQSTTTKKLSALQIQVATKNAMALIREAAALRQIAKDQELSLQRRINLLTQAAAKEIEGFRIQKDANIKNERELAAAVLQINAKLAADLAKLGNRGLLLAEEVEDESIAVFDAETKRIDALIDKELELQRVRESIQDARVESTKNVLGILTSIAGEESEAQRIILKAKQLAAVGEIIINKNRAIAAIRAREEITDSERRSKIFAVQSGAALGIVEVLATGFAEGGYTGDGGKHDIAGNVHKGEFVIDKETTAKTGLRGASMEDFKQRFDTNLMMSPHAFKAMELGNPVRSQDINYKAIIASNELTAATIKKAIEQNRSVQTIDISKLGEIVQTLKRFNGTTISTYKNDNL